MNVGIQVGEMAIVENGEGFIFVYEQYDEFTPYKQVRVSDMSIVDAYPESVFEQVKIGFEMPIGGKVIQIISREELRL